jgi:UDP-GlcNAc:undecaprenyl-phosphate GlcNAc-1-phosphate transferase
MEPSEALVGTILLSLALAAAVAFFLTPIVRDLARQQDWVDRPDGHRKLHLHPVPRLGGVAVFVAFAAACAVLLAAQRAGWSTAIGPSSAYLHLLLAGLGVVIVGVVDDIVGVRPLTKIVVQTLAATYLFVNGYQITALSNPLTGDSIELGWASLPLTVLWFVAMSNAFNLIDGLDGLAAGIGLFSTTTLFIACAINERWEIAIIAAAMGGALLGFLRYNFNPASVFLGDSGALFLGFALAAIAVRGSMKSSAAIAVAAPLMALAVPILDASIAVLRRLVRGEHPFQADGDHIHHRLLRMGLTPRRVVAVLYTVAAGFGVLSLLTMTTKSQIVGMVVIASSVVTWIGVQQLGYAEFSEIQRTLRFGIGNERRAMGNNVYLASLAQRFAEATDAGQLHALMAEALDRLGFQRAELHWEDAAVGPRIAATLPTWERESSDGLAQPTSTWRIPLMADGRVAAMVSLTRPLSRQAQFDPGYLLTAIQGFGSRLLSMDAAPEASKPAERRPAISAQG